MACLHDGLDQGVDVLARLVRPEPIGQRDESAPGSVQEHVRPGPEVVVGGGAVSVSERLNGKRRWEVGGWHTSER